MCNDVPAWNATVLPLHKTIHIKTVLRIFLSDFTRGDPEILSSSCCSCRDQQTQLQCIREKLTQIIAALLVRRDAFNTHMLTYTLRTHSMLPPHCRLTRAPVQLSYLYLRNVSSQRIVALPECTDRV